MRIDVRGAIVPNDDAWIYDYLGVENCCPAAVTSKLAEAAGTDVDVYINSGGGDIISGSEIYDALRGYEGDVKIHIPAAAASAASMIACAGWCDIAPTAMIMVHNAANDGSYGDYHVKDRESAMLKTANEAIAAAYVEKTGMSMADVLKMMDRETWLTAEKAVEVGLVDEISRPAQRLVAAAGGLLPAAAVERIRRTVKSPAAIRAQAELDFLKLKGERK